MVAELGKLSKLKQIKVVDRLQKSEGLLSEPKLERNSNLREWQCVYLQQEVAFLSEKYKKEHGKQKKVKSTRKILKI